MFNIALFLFLYLPLTALSGLLWGSFQSPGIERNLFYELFLWFVVTVQLIAPTFVALISVFLLLRVVIWLFDIHQHIFQRALALATTSLILPLIQAWTWGGNHLSVDWFLVAVFPASILSLLIRLPGQGESHVTRH